jgi:Flp pilus assembly protein TadB
MLRHTLDSGTGFSQDGLLSTARDFNNFTTKRNRGKRFTSKWLHAFAWLTGAVLAVVYLLWFFKNIFEHTVR